MSMVFVGMLLLLKLRQGRFAHPIKGTETHDDYITANGRHSETCNLIERTLPRSSSHTHLKLLVFRA